MTSKEWKKVKVDKLGIIKTGKTPKTNKKENYGGNIPFLTPTDNMEAKRVAKTIKTLSNIGLEEVKNCLIPQNSICVSCIGSDLGKVVITSEPTVTNQQINSIVIDNKICNVDFVYYSMLQLGKILNYHSKTSTAVPIINKTQFSNYEIKLPPLETQEKIAKVLSSLDDKIELNNKINQNLEQQAQAIFKSWFVDFEPFGGKMPDDWRIGKVEEIINIYDSKRIPLSNKERSEMTKKVYPYYGATSLMDYVDNYIFDGIYLLLGEDGTVIDNLGFPILQYVWGKFWVNNHAHILTGKNGYSVESLYLFFKQKNIKSIVTGAVQAKISQNNLKNLDTLIPSKSTMNEFNKMITPLFDAIRNNTNENKQLTQLRDTLLPKLMSGEIDVDRVEV